MQKAITAGQNAALIADVKHTYEIASGVSMSLEQWQVAVVGEAVSGYTPNALSLGVGEPFLSIIESAVSGLKEKIAATVLKVVGLLPLEAETETGTNPVDVAILGGDPTP